MYNILDILIFQKGSMLSHENKHNTNTENNFEIDLSSFKGYDQISSQKKK